jgi:hypothetical protein
MRLRCEPDGDVVSNMLRFWKLEADVETWNSQIPILLPRLLTVDVQGPVARGGVVLMGN